MDFLHSGIKLPIDTIQFFDNLQIERCGLDESIANHVRLLITTVYGESDADPLFGCEIWEYEFEHPHINNLWIDRISLQIKERLQVYESRLQGIQVQAEITQAEFKTEGDSGMEVRLKKRLNISVTGKLVTTNESFYLRDSILLSPFSTD